MTIEEFKERVKTRQALNTEEILRFIAAFRLPCARFVQGISSILHRFRQEYHRR